jgi:hypothetical protein
VQEAVGKLLELLPSVLGKDGRRSLGLAKHFVPAIKSLFAEEPLIKGLEGGCDLCHSSHLVAGGEEYNPLCALHVLAAAVEVVLRWEGKFMNLPTWFAQFSPGSMLKHELVLQLENSSPASRKELTKCGKFDLFLAWVSDCPMPN